METYRIGDIIREERTRQSITQEELSYGICSVPTLSRIENATQKPSMKIREALLERLGYNTDGLRVCADDDEIRKYCLEHEIRVKGMQQEDASELIAEYKELIASRSAEGKLEKQFIKMTEALNNMRKEDVSLDNLAENLLDSIRMTIPNFEVSEINKYGLLTFTESIILNNMAIIYARQKKYTAAINILKHLVAIKESRSNGIQEEYTILMANLVKLLMRIGDYEGMFEYSERGIEYCLKQKRLQGLPQLLLCNGRALLKKQRIKEGIIRYEQVIMLLEMEHDVKGAHAIKNELQEIKQGEI